MDTLVWDTADACKHTLTHTHLLLVSTTEQASLHTQTHAPFKSNTIKPFSDFACTSLNMAYSLNINLGYIKAVVCAAL